MAMHAVFSLTGGVTLLAGLLQEGLLSTIASASQGLWEVDALSSRLLDAHAGFLLYSLILYTRHYGSLRPPYALTLLHHAGLLACWLAAKLFPCTLTRQLLPLHQLGAVAGLAHAWRDLAVVLGTGRRAHVRRLRLEAAALAWKLVLATVAAYWSWLFFRRHPLWTQADRIAPDLAVLSRLDSMVVLSTSAMLVLIYTLWVKDVRGGRCRGGGSDRF